MANVLVSNEDIEEYVTEINIPFTVYTNIWSLSKYRNIEFETIQMDEKKLGEDLKLNSFIEIKGIRSHPNGNKYQAIIVMLGPESLSGFKLPNFRRLLSIVLKPYKKYDNIQLMTISAGPLAKAIEREMSGEMSAYPGLYFEYFKYEDFIIVKPEAQICPKQEILPPSEVEALCAKYNTRKEYWPRISAKDAQALWLGPFSGDVIKVTRYSDISGENIIYRYVV